MATHIHYNQFGPQFIKEGIHPRVIQRSLANAINPKTMRGSMKEGPADITYIASINDPSVSYTHTLGVYSVNLPIDIDVDVRLAGIISKRYMLKAFVPFDLIVETYAPLVIFINYRQVQASSINISGNGGGGDLIYKKVKQEIPSTLASEVNKALAGSYQQRIIDVLKSVQDSFGAASLENLNTVENENIFSEEEIKEILSGSENNASTDETKSELAKSEKQAIINQFYYLNESETKALYSSSANARRLNYSQFGIEFLRLVTTARVIQKKFNEVIRQDNIKSDFFTKDGHQVSYYAVIEPARVQNQKFGDFLVTISLNIRLSVAIGGVWRESWVIYTAVPFAMRIETYANPLLLYLRVYPVEKKYIRVVSKQQTLTGVAWGSVVNELYDSLQTEVNKSLRDSNSARSINLVREIGNIGGMSAMEKNGSTELDTNYDEKENLEISSEFNSLIS